MNILSLRHHVLAQIARGSRSFCIKRPPTPNQSIYVSKSTDPYFNLTFEDWLFRHKAPDGPLLFVYRDDPCVILGRNQNPWKEINIPTLRKIGIPFVRRRSGGGTVYHDLGNTNFSIHLPRVSFNRQTTGNIALRAVRALEIDAQLNDRNDICVGTDKVSGSAYKIVNTRAYHHGTMLISTQLNTLGDLLHGADNDKMITRGVPSVRSPVCNLRQFNASVTHEGFVEAMIAEFRDEFDIHDPIEVVDNTEDMKSVEYISKGMDELRSWEWAYGQTPKFTYTLNRIFDWGDVTAEIESEHGIIVSCSLTNNDAPSTYLSYLTDVSEHLQGKRYGFVEDNSSWEGRSRDVWNWLISVMDK